jgi:quercetin dioxygenase-like cupin family protein
MKKSKSEWIYLGIVAIAFLICTGFHHLSAGAAGAFAEYKPGIQVTQLLKSATTTLGQQIDFSQIKQAEVNALKVVIPPGQETGWHKHPHAGYAYLLQGRLTLEIEGKQPLTVEPGTALVEVFNTYHNGKNLGSEPVSILVFFTGEVGEPYTIRAMLPGTTLTQIGDQ